MSAAAEGLDAAEYLILHVWRATGDPLHDIRHKWTVGDLFLALQGLRVEDAWRKATKNDRP